MYEPPHSRFNPLSLVNFLFIALVLGAGVYRRWQASKVIIDAPFLVAILTNGMKLENVSSGKLQGYWYTLAVTSPLEPVDSYMLNNINPAGAAAQAVATSIASSQAGKILLTLTLPVKSKVHIASIGIPDQKTHSGYDYEARKCGLEPASLEGDFPEYFSLYCSKEHQVELRQVLDPATMAFLVDYCKRQDWELIGDTLFFIQSSLHSKADQNDTTRSNNVEDAQNFITKVLPTLQRMKGIPASTPRADG